MERSLKPEDPGHLSLCQHEPNLRNNRSKAAPLASGRRLFCQLARSRDSWGNGAERLQQPAREAEHIAILERSAHGLSNEHTVRARASLWSDLRQEEQNKEAVPKTSGLPLSLT